MARFPFMLTKHENLFFSKLLMPEDSARSRGEKTNQIRLEILLKYEIEV